MNNVLSVCVISGKFLGTSNLCMSNCEFLHMDCLFVSQQRMASPCARWRSVPATDLSWLALTFGAYVPVQKFVEEGICQVAAGEGTESVVIFVKLLPLRDAL